MRKHLKEISIVGSLVVVLVVLGGTLDTHTVHAQTGNPIIDLGIGSVGAAAGEALTGAGNLVLKALNAFFLGLVNDFLRLMGLVTQLAGVALNSVVYYTVAQMGSNLSNPQISGTITNTWTVVRDVANMFFIFVLLYAAIRTILGIGDDTRKLIVNMIVAAILINFSLFFTKVIIDAANLLALTFYSAIAPGATGADGALKFLDVGISNAFVNILNLQTIWKAAGTISTGSVITIGVLGSLVLLVSAFTFFAIAIMFVIRYVILILVLVLSPLMFVSMILPQLKSYTGKWWDALMGQAFFAPVYFFLTWITINLLNGIVGAVGVSGKDWSKTLATGSVQTGNTYANHFGTDAISLLIFFIIVIVFLIASLIISVGIANRAGPQATAMAKWATGLAGNTVLGGVGYASRRTLGAAGRIVANSETLKNMRREKGLSGLAARMTMAAGRGTAGSSFDLRSLPGLGKPLDAGKPQTGGYDQYIKDEAKKREERAKAETEVTEIAKNEARMNLENAESALREARSAQSKTRDEAARKVDGEFARPTELADLERRQAEAEENAKQEEERANSTLIKGTPAEAEARERAQKSREEAERLKQQAEAMAESYNTERNRRIDEELDQSDVPNVQEAQTNKDNAQAEYDRLFGASEKEQKERLDKERVETEKNDPAVRKQAELARQVASLTEKVKTATGALKEQLTKELGVKTKEFDLAKKEADERKEQIKNEFKAREESIKKIESIGDERKRSAAIDMARPGFISTDRVGFVGSVKMSSLQAAADLRKGKKPVRDQLEEILKAEGELKGEEKKVEAAIEDLAEKTGK